MTREDIIQECVSAIAVKWQFYNNGTRLPEQILDKVLATLEESLPDIPVQNGTFEGQSLKGE